MQKLNKNRTYVEFLLEKGEDYTLDTIFNEPKNSSLLKEFSTGMIETEVTLENVIDNLKSSGVPLPDIRYLNSSHEEKIYNLALSSYALDYMEGKIEELSKKEEVLFSQSEEVKSLGAIEDIEAFEKDLAAIRAEKEDLAQQCEEKYTSVLKDSAAIDAFILGDEKEVEKVKGVSQEEKEKAAEILEEKESSEIRSGVGVSEFIRQVQASIDRVDKILAKCQIILETHDPSAEIENEQVEKILSEMENDNQNDNSNKETIKADFMEKAEREKVHVEGRDYFVTSKFAKNNRDEINSYLKDHPVEGVILEKDGVVFVAHKADLGQSKEDIINRAKLIKEREVSVADTLGVAIPHLQEPLIERELEKPTKEMLSLIASHGDGNVYAGDLYKEHTIFGVDDTMKSIDEYTKDIEKSQLYQAYISGDKILQEQIVQKTNNTKGSDKQAFNEELFLDSVKSSNEKARESKQSLEDTSSAPKI